MNRDVDEKAACCCARRPSVTEGNQETKDQFNVVTAYDYVSLCLMGLVARITEPDNVNAMCRFKEGSEIRTSLGDHVLNQQILSSMVNTTIKYALG